MVFDPMGARFNDADGTIHQRACQGVTIEESCGYLDLDTGSTKRVDSKGIPFDVYWKFLNGRYQCTQGLGKCMNGNCENLNGFFATNP